MRGVRRKILDAANRTVRQGRQWLSEVRQRFPMVPVGTVLICVAAAYLLFSALANEVRQGRLALPSLRPHLVSLHNLGQGITHAIGQVPAPSIPALAAVVLTAAVVLLVVFFGRIGAWRRLRGRLSLKAGQQSMKGWGRSPLLFAAVAFVLAGFGQSLLGGAHKNIAWILYGMAVVLFVIAFRRASVARFALGHLGETPDAVSPSRLFFALVGLSLVAMGGSVVLFGVPTQAPLAWTVHIVSVLLLIAAVISQRRPSRAGPPSSTSFNARLLRALPLVAVLAIAAFARLWQLATYPFGDWYDEAQNGLAALKILQDPTFRPVFFDYTEMPAHFNYLIALSFRAFGVNPFAVRVVTAGFGIGAVLFAYLLFRRWFGEWLGILAAGVLAVMRYHLTFSRFGMQGVATPVFELAALYFLDRALDKKKVADFAWFGLTLGFGLAFYHAFRLFPLVLAIFLFALFVASWAKIGFRETFMRYVRRLGLQWLIAAIALLIAVAPVAQFAARNQQLFFHRLGMTSLFQNHGQEDLGKAYLSNLEKHLLMFNVQGDRNGRHNLPGTPMLDPVMGVMFVLGAAYSLWRWRDPPNLLMLLIFIVMLHGGILSLDFEAPQSLRSIGVIPALVYLITLPAAAVVQHIQTASKKVDWEGSIGEQESSGRAITLRSIFLYVGLIASLSILAYLNLSLFFGQQETDPASWAQHSAAETLVANEMNRLNDRYDFVVTALFDKSPTVLLMARNITNLQRWTVSDRLPLIRSNPGRGVIMMLDEKLMSAYDDAKRFYPQAKFIQNHAPAGGGTVMWEVVLSPDDLRSVEGVTARYFVGQQIEGKPAKEETLNQISVDWTKTQPLPVPFVAEIRGTLVAQEYGRYRFEMPGAAGAQLWIDEFPVGDEPISLAKGTHALRLQIPSSTARAELWWQPPDAAQAQPVPAANLFRPPVTNNGLLGSYYSSPDWSGDPAFTQIDPEIDYYFHVVPLQRPYSVEWRGKLYAPTSGDYIFALASVDGSKLTLDDKMVVDNPAGHTTIDGATHLEQGWHDVSVRFSDKTGGTQIYLYWTPPGAGEREIIPSRYLLPPMGQYPLSGVVANQP